MQSTRFVTEAHNPPPEPAPPTARVTVILWHERHGTARASVLPESLLSLSRATLAWLIACTVLRDPGREVLVDDIVHLPATDGLSRILGPVPRPADLEHALAHAPEKTGGPVPVADPSTGAVNVMARRCDTCIYRRAMRRAIGGGRIDALIADALARDGHVVCHQTLREYQGPDGALPFAICHGFATAHPACAALRAADAFAGVRYIEPVTAATGEGG